MEPNVNQERQQAHALLDMLSPEKVPAVRSLLEVMVEAPTKSYRVGVCSGLVRGDPLPAHRRRAP